MNFEAANITFVAGKNIFCGLNINFCNGNKYENAQYSFWALKNQLEKKLSNIAAAKSDLKQVKIKILLLF